VGFEAVQLTLGYSFNNLKLRKICAKASEYNKKSIKLSKKAGFKFIKKIPNDRMIFHNNKWVKSDTLCMELAKKDYDKIK
jgi:RimJ/RimL family protein N-acetyltransferase